MLTRAIAERNCYLAEPALGLRRACRHRADLNLFWCQISVTIRPHLRAKTIEMDLVRADNLLKMLARKQLLVGQLGCNTPQANETRPCAHPCLLCRWCHKQTSRRRRSLYRCAGHVIILASLQRTSSPVASPTFADASRTRAQTRVLMKLQVCTATLRRNAR